MFPSTMNDVLENYGSVLVFYLCVMSPDEELHQPDHSFAAATKAVLD